MKEEIKLFKILLDTIDGLSEEELSALLSGKAHLKIEPSGEQKSNESVYVIPNDFLTQLESCDSRESAQKLFNESNFTSLILYIGKFTIKSLHMVQTSLQFWSYIL